MELISFSCPCCFSLGQRYVYSGSDLPTLIPDRKLLYGRSQERNSPNPRLTLPTASPSDSLAAPASVMTKTGNLPLTSPSSRCHSELQCPNLGTVASGLLLCLPVFFALLFWLKWPDSQKERGQSVDSGLKRHPSLSWPRGSLRGNVHLITQESGRRLVFRKAPGPSLPCCLAPSPSYSHSCSHFPGMRMTISDGRPLPSLPVCRSCTSCRKRGQTSLWWPEMKEAPLQGAAAERMGVPQGPLTRLPLPRRQEKG